MSPEQERIQELENKVNKLMEVLDVPFIENVKRRCIAPVITDFGLDNVVSKSGTGNTAGVFQAVNEAGTGSYDVAAEFDGTITVTDTDGTSYKLGYYTP